MQTNLLKNEGVKAAENSYNHSKKKPSNINQTVPEELNPSSGYCTDKYCVFCNTMRKAFRNVLEELRK